MPFLCIVVLLQVRKVGGNTGMDMIMMLVVWVVVLGLMWVLLMRPQKKEQKRSYGIG